MKKLLYLLVLITGTLPAFAQVIRITGRVTDDSGTALIGVTVQEKGTMRGTVTDVTGQFGLSVRENATLVVSYVGYVTKEVILQGNRVLTITLSQNVDLIGGVEVVGSRSMNRSATETSVPVDIISVSEVTGSSGQLEMSQLLQYVAPSFNANRQSGSDGSDHVDPASLRGLGPDQTLVLINGKRRHQSSLINFYGSRGRGNTGTDLNAIPASAIERIEILRDGAAAQYGSDAIAGVINIVLKENTDAFEVNVNTGMYSAGDGQQAQVALNWGKSLLKGGFVHITAEGMTRDYTNRPNDEALFPGSSARDFVGDAKALSGAFLVNMAVPVNSMKFYLNGGYSHRFSNNHQWTRGADNLQRNIKEIYQNGFTPQLEGTVSDPSVSFGLKGKRSGWNWDLSNSYGENKFDYHSKNTLNASYQPRPSSPTEFYDGGFKLTQNTTNLDITRYFQKGNGKGFNVAFGAEFRNERYQIFAGEEASYKNYGAMVMTDQGLALAASGAQGFPGFQPSDEIDERRSNFGAYADVEVDLNKQLSLTAAGRFENYSDFGNTINGKASFRFALSPAVALRGSLSTGFRAPSLAQIYFNSTITNFIAGKPVDNLIARNSGNVAKALGIPALKQETSQNISLGVTLTPANGFSLTLDAYQVRLKDRIILTGVFSDEDDAIGSILKGLNVGGAQFFTNALDADTKGLDVVLNHSTFVGQGRLRTSLAANFNELEIGDVKTTTQLKGKEDTYFDLRERYFLLASAPPSKFNVGFDYKQNKLSANLRFTRFDKVTLANWEYDENKLHVYDPRITTDFSLGYDLAKNIQLNLGGANIFNVQPNKQDPGLTESGGMWDAVQMGINGAFFFAKLGFRF
ncbi:MAG TPA: TonB-dependent receptor [Rhodothermales bacterium]|nr:TonB-dependent receptor [Rhodothermales bacterium]